MLLSDVDARRIGMIGDGDGAWVNWVGRWTAEEGRHAIVLRDYLTVTRNIDPVLLVRWERRGTPIDSGAQVALRRRLLEPDIGDAALPDVAGKPGVATDAVDLHVHRERRRRGVRRALRRACEAGARAS